MATQKRKVQIFWDKNPCEGRWSDLEKLKEFRYSKAPYLKELIDNNIKKGSRVLEVGCGQGVDLSLISGITNLAYAIDLSPHSVRLAKRVLNQAGLKANVSIGDAENLRFRKNFFDIVYSCGVLHHTPDTEKALGEVYKIIKPGGKAIVLLYSKFSLQYLIFWIARSLTKPWRDKLAKMFEAKKEDSHIGTALVELFETPILKAYTNTELKKMLRDFANIQLQKYQTGPLRFRSAIKNKTIKRVVDLFESATGRYLGFHVVVIAEK